VGSPCGKKPQDGLCFDAPLAGEKAEHVESQAYNLAWCGFLEREDLVGAETGFPLWFSQATGR